MSKSRLLERIRTRFANDYKDVKKCIVPYSGGLDTSVIVSLLEDLGIDIITLTLDIGQEKELKAIENKARRLGAKKHIAINAVDEFARDFVYKAVKANALYDNYVISEALSRPLLVRHLASIAKKEKAQAIAHGGSGKGNDQIRIDNGIRAIAPNLRIIAPIRDWDLRRDEEIEYALSKGFIEKEEKPHYSTDENLWGRIIRSGMIENASNEIPNDAFEWAVALEATPDKSIYVELEFSMGVPVVMRTFDAGKKLTNQIMGTKIIQVLNMLAGAHGIGRVDTIENKTVGIKIRAGIEAPAATVIVLAHKELEKFVLTANEMNFKSDVDRLWSKLVYEGAWYTRLKEGLDTFIDKAEEVVSGKVMLKLYKGNAEVIGRSSSNALYDVYLSSYGNESVWDQQEARAFAKIYGLEEVMAYLVKKHER